MQGWFILITIFAMGLFTSCRMRQLPGSIVKEEVSVNFSAADFTKLDSLLSHCSKCHANGTKEGGFGLTGNLVELANRKDYVTKGDPEDSYLWQRVVESADMPPTGAASYPTDDQRQILTKWIKAGAPLQKTVRPVVTQPQIFAAVRRDLESTNTSARPFIRYFSLANLHNLQVDGSSVIKEDEQFEAFRNGISILINSLHWRKEITPPTIVKATEKTILRIDLRDYFSTPQELQRAGLDFLLRRTDRVDYQNHGVGLTPEIWNIISNENPYKISYSDADFRAIINLVGTPHRPVPFPIIRADFFTFIAARSHNPDPKKFEDSKKFMYYQILGIPDNLGPLEKALLGGETTVERLVNGRPVTRSGFVDSGVSDHNRLLEKHPISNYRGINGSTPAYWLSYDFDSSVRRKDFKRNPIGPIAAFGDRDKVFDHDGGEVIFALPNGMHAYVLANDIGNVIDEGPQAIVRDPRRGVIYNGFSCMDCHSGGMLDKADTVQEAVESQIAAGIYSDSDRAILGRLYFTTPEKLSAEFANDTSAYLAAKSKTMLPGTRLQGLNFKAVPALYDRFETEVNPDTAASELNLPVEELLRLLKGNEKLVPVLSAFENKKRNIMKRETFRDFFPRIVSELKLADYYSNAQDQLENGARVQCEYEIRDKNDQRVDLKDRFLGESSQSQNDAALKASASCEKRLSPGLKRGGYYCIQKECEQISKTGSTK